MITERTSNEMEDIINLEVEIEGGNFVISNVPHEIIKRVKGEKHVRTLEVELKLSKIYKHMKEKDIRRLDFMEFKEE